MAPYAMEEILHSNGHSAANLSSNEDSPLSGYKSALLHRSLVEEPSEVVAVKDSIVTLASGRKIIDACGGATVSCLGHGNEEVLAATLSQLRSVSYVHTGAYTTAAAESLAAHLLHKNPYNLSKAFFVSSGSEAIDATLKLSRQYWYEVDGPSTRRRNFVARRQGYHGGTIGAMSVSSNLPRKIPYEPLLMGNVSFVSPAYAYQYRRRDENTEQYVIRLAEELENEFLKLVPETVVAFLAETVVGATSGCTPAPKGYFRAVREVCDRYGILLILDEIMCGMGRMGTKFAFEREGHGVFPDIMTIGKGLGGGYAPIVGMLVSERVVKGLAEGSAVINHGQTYQAHPLSCATALAVQRIIERDALVKRCAVMGSVLEELLRKQLSNFKYVGDIRGGGLFWGIEFVRDRKTRESLEPCVQFGCRVQKEAFERGVAIYPGAATVDGVKGDHVLLAPSYTITRGELENIIQVVVEAYTTVEMKYGDEEEGRRKTDSNRNPEQAV